MYQPTVGARCLVPLYTEIQCNVSRNIVIPEKRARSNVPLQWNNLARQRQIQYLQSVSNEMNKEDAGLNECAPSNPSD